MPKHTRKQKRSTRRRSHRSKTRRGGFWPFGSSSKSPFTNAGPSANAAYELNLVRNQPNPTLSNEARAGLIRKAYNSFKNSGQPANSWPTYRNNVLRRGSL